MFVKLGWQINVENYFKDQRRSFVFFTYHPLHSTLVSAPSLYILPFSLQTNNSIILGGEVNKCRRLFNQGDSRQNIYFPCQLYVINILGEILYLKFYVYVKLRDVRNPFLQNTMYTELPTKNTVRNLVILFYCSFCSVQLESCFLLS